MRCLDYVAGLMLFCCVIISCGKESTKPAPSLAYFNSFESAEDTAGWQGIKEEFFVPHPAPYGGNRSLHIGGGCIQPTAYLTLPPQAGDRNYRISCWGKAPEQSQAGNVILTTTYIGVEREYIQLIINHKEWTFYKSEESLFCPANYSLRIEIYIGGIVPAYMFIDCIKIEEVK